eukprot:scaffold25714_cov30-Tisochrysis_lutea.AAC.5
MPTSRAVKQGLCNYCWMAALRGLSDEPPRRRGASQVGRSGEGGLGSGAVAARSIGQTLHNTTLAKRAAIALRPRPLCAWPNVMAQRSAHWAWATQPNTEDKGLRGGVKGKKRDKGDGLCLPVRGRAYQ